MNYTAKHFSLNLPQGEGQGNIPELLRHLAKELDKRKGIEVYDITFHDESDENSQPWPYFTVYYNDMDNT